MQWEVSERMDEIKNNTIYGVIFYFILFFNSFFKRAIS